MNGKYVLTNDSEKLEFHYLLKDNVNLQFQMFVDKLEEEDDEILVFYTDNLQLVFIVSMKNNKMLGIQFDNQDIVILSDYADLSKHESQVIRELLATFCVSPEYETYELLQVALISKYIELEMITPEKIRDKNVNKESMFYDRLFTHN